MSQNDDIFDDDFSDFEGAGFDEGESQSESGSSNSLLDLWNNNPLVKIVIIAAILVIGLGSVYAFVLRDDSGEPERSRLGTASDGREAPGQVVSENFADALDERNQQNLEAALGNRNVSAIPVPVNRGDNSLRFDSTQDVQVEDPLAIWQRENREPEPVVPFQDPTVEEVIPEPLILPPPPPQQQGVVQPDLAGLDQAINNQIQSILANRQVRPGQFQSLPTEDANAASLGRSAAGANQDGLVDASTPGRNQGTQTQEILVPAGTILYGQILNEANSDSPGPILAQVLSGPVSGARLIGQFQEQNEKLIITFNTAVVEGVGRQTNAVAIDPATTSPGLATDIDRRYLRRIIIPAAAEFIEGMGAAFAEQESQVFTSGDVIVTNTSELDTGEQLAAGIERGAERASQILEQDANRLRPLITVEAGTPIGIILVDPILKANDNAPTFGLDTN